MITIPPSIVLETALETAKVHVEGEGACCKSIRVAVLFKRTRREHTEDVEVIASSTNGPPLPFFCDRSESCRQQCGKICVHAEEGALLCSDFMTTHRADLLHAKIVDGRIVPSGPPSCWQCSRAILFRDLAGVWLLHEEGWHRYTALEFHTLTLEHNKLPTSREDNTMHKPTGLRVEFYEDATGKFRWTQYAENGEIRDASSESFHDMAYAKQNWDERLSEAEAIKASGAIYVREVSGDRVKTTLGGSR